MSTENKVQSQSNTTDSKVKKPPFPEPTLKGIYYSVEELWEAGEAYAKRMRRMEETLRT